MIRIEGLRKRYGNASPWVLDGIDLQVPAGSLFGLLGPNGAGKSTLIHLLMGLISADGGTIEMDGLLVSTGARTRSGHVGFAPQSLALYPTLTTAENLQLFAALQWPSARRREVIDEVIAATQLEKHLGQFAKSLSGGLQRRLNLAIAMLGRPRLLVLDEPTVGVDAQSRAFILERIRQLNADGTTVVYTTHYMDEVQRLCDHVAVIDHGRILACDALAALVGDAPDLETAYLRLTHTALRD